MKKNFWESKTLNELSEQEWESLCDGCGKCCLEKLEDEDSGEIYYTCISCKLLDTSSCQCKNYPDRKKYVPDCIKLTPEQVQDFVWLPPTCAYRLVAQGQPLPHWHPLLSGDKNSVHAFGQSVREYAISELAISEDDIHNYIIPLELIS